MGARLPLRPRAARPRRHPGRSGLRQTPAMADKLIPTPSQTVGPFFHLGMARAEWADLTTDNPAGERIAIEGRVIDGDGAPVPDAIIELWQANAAGRYNHPDDAQAGNALQAPHINIALFARGLLKHLFTRIYFAEEPANTSDPLLTSIEEEAARRTLLASRTAGGSPALYRFDLILQGENETAFLDI